MSSILWIFVSIGALFFLILLIREMFERKTKEKICAICFAVGLTWLSLLILNYLNYFDNPTIIALLIGMTLLGVYYTIEKKVRKELTLFRLPFLLTLIIAGYSLIEGFNYGFGVLVLLATLWIIFIFIYLYGSENKSGSLVKKLVECCRKW